MGRRGYAGWLTVAMLGSAFGVSGGVSRAAASPAAPPPLPMAISGTVEWPDGTPWTQGATVTALVAGQPAGQVSVPAGTGQFGGSATAAQLLVQGSGSVGAPVAFTVTVNGEAIPATVGGSAYTVYSPEGAASAASGPVTWQPGEVIHGLVLQLAAAPPTGAASGGGSGPVSGGGGGGGGGAVGSGTTSASGAPSGSATASFAAGQGGTVSATTANGTAITLTVPPAAVAQTVSVTVTPLNEVPSTVAAIPVVQAVEITSTGSGRLQAPVTVTITFPEPPGPVTVVFWNPLLAQWQPIPGVTVSGDTVQFTTSHLTVFAVTAVGAVPRVQRVAGASRIGTAIAAAEAAFPDGAASVVLANAGQGAPSPDALAAAGLAGAVEGPILLTAPDHLPQAVRQALTTLGARTVYVVGGPAAVSDAVVQALAAAGLTVVRQFEGADRFQTAALIDQYLYGQGLTQATTAFVANGATMVDALSASPVVFREAAPLLLVNTGQTALPGSALQTLEQAGIRRVILLGGPAAVPPAIAQQVRQALPGVLVSRLGGATRNATAVAIAQAFFGSHPGGAVIAANGGGGGSFVDALSAAPLAGVNAIPLVLSNPASLPASTQQYLHGVPGGSPLWVMGGPAAVTDGVMTAVSALAAGSSAAPAFAVPAR